MELFIIDIRLLHLDLIIALVVINVIYNVIIDWLYNVIIDLVRLKIHKATIKRRESGHSIRNHIS